MNSLKEMLVPSVMKEKEFDSLSRSTLERIGRLLVSEAHLNAILSCGSARREVTKQYPTIGLRN